MLAVVSSLSYRHLCGIVDCCIIVLLMFVDCCIIVLLSYYCHRCRHILIDVSSSLYHHIVIFILNVLSYCCPTVALLSYHRISSSNRNFDKPAKIMACGTLTPIVVWRNHTAALTFFSCAALFFGMLAIALYSVVTLLNMNLQ